MIRLNFRASVCLLALVLVAGCDGKGAGGNDGTAAFTAAADALSAKLASGSVPPATDPAVTAFETQTANGLKSLGTPALPVTGFDSYDSLCGKTATIVATTIGIGTDQSPDKNAAMTANITRYMDQIFTPLLFSAHCSAAHMPFIEKQIGDDVASKREPLQKVRDGAYGQASGLLQMAGASDLDLPRRTRIVDMLGADAGNFAIVFSQQQRAGLASIVDSLPEDVRAKAAAIKTGLQQAPCGKLCAM